MHRPGIQKHSVSDRALDLGLRVRRALLAQMLLEKRVASIPVKTACTPDCLVCLPFSKYKVTPSRPYRPSIQHAKDLGENLTEFQNYGLHVLERPHAAKMLFESKKG